MTKISLGYNAVPLKAKKLVLDVLRSGQYSPGPKVKEFEEKFAALHKAKYAVFVNSGTDALRLSLLALKEKYGWKDGSRVAVPALTFVATVNVIVQAGLKPFFIDVSMHDYLINPFNLERRLGDHHADVVALMPVHLFGKSCGSAIFDLAKRLKLKVLEDSCETILNPVRGDVSCHSTYMAHHVTTGVGGLALTNDSDLNWLIRSYANHGRNVAYIPGYHQAPLTKSLLTRRFSYDRIGYSSRATEFEAVLGLSQLPMAKENVYRRWRVAEALSKALAFWDFVTPDFSYSHEHTFMMYPIVIREFSKIDKLDLCFHLEKDGIETRDMMPITTQLCYKPIFAEESFSVASWINKNGFYIPCTPAMTPQDIERIHKSFARYLDKK